MEPEQVDLRVNYIFHVGLPGTSLETTCFEAGTRQVHRYNIYKDMLLKIRYAKISQICCLRGYIAYKVTLCNHISFCE